MAKASAFTPDSARRIARAVLNVERSTTTLLPRRRRPAQILSSGETLPPGENTNDILRWEENSASSGSSESGGQWVLHSAPPIVGNFALMVQDGVMKWEAYRTFVCDEDSGSAEEEQQEW